MTKTIVCSIKTEEGCSFKLEFWYEECWILHKIPIGFCVFDKTEKKLKSYAIIIKTDKRKILFLTTVKPLIKNTSKEFIKCRFLNLLIIECRKYLVFLLNIYMELFKSVPTVPAYFKAVFIFLQKKKQKNYYLGKNITFNKEILIFFLWATFIPSLSIEQLPL